MEEDNTNIPDILYKYRSLSNFKHFVDIILNNRLYASNYFDLNDPMEGFYKYTAGLLDRHIIEKLKGEKRRLKICSLSKLRNNQQMWSRYADENRGVVIAVKIDRIKLRPKLIKYNGLMYFQESDYSFNSAEKILSHKNDFWSYEEEVRVFTHEEYVSVKILEIITGRKMTKTDCKFLERLKQKVNPAIDISNQPSDDY